MAREVQRLPATVQDVSPFYFMAVHAYARRPLQTSICAPRHSALYLAGHRPLSPRGVGYTRKSSTRRLRRPDVSSLARMWKRNKSSHPPKTGLQFEDGVPSSSSPREQTRNRDTTMAMDWYNGYSGRERARAGRAIARARAAGELRPAACCMLCGDPAAKLDLHSEDYSEPYRFDPPAAYWVCISCHRNHLHKRFGKPRAWAAFQAHVRRGGYASDLRKTAIRHEVTAFETALAANQAASLVVIRPFQPRDPWWERLSVDPASQPDPAARPRP